MLNSLILNMESPPKKLLEVVRDTIRLKHYSSKTEKSYINKIYKRDMAQSTSLLL